MKIIFQKDPEFPTFLVIIDLSSLPRNQFNDWVAKNYNRLDDIREFWGCYINVMYSQQNIYFSKS